MKLIIILFFVLILTFNVNAAVNVTTNIDSDGGDINAWINPNSGEGETTYYLDGINFEERMEETDTRISSAARSGRNVIDNIYKVFMELRYNPSLGERVWEEVDFNDLYGDYQKLRYVLESWFVPRSEMVQVIHNQQTQISQLQLEIEAISRVVNQEQLCNSRQQVMIETGIESVTCGNTTYYNEGDMIIGLKSIN